VSANYTQSLKKARLEQHQLNNQLQHAKQVKQSAGGNLLGQSQNVRAVMRSLSDNQHILAHVKCNDLTDDAGEDSADQVKCGKGGVGLVNNNGVKLGAVTAGSATGHQRSLSLPKSFLSDRYGLNGFRAALPRSVHLYVLSQSVRSDLVIVHLWTEDNVLYLLFVC
jgi:hypothetical protein